MGFKGSNPLYIAFHSIPFYSIMVYINDYKQKAHYEWY